MDSCPDRACDRRAALPAVRAMLAAFGFALLLALAFQGARGLWDPDEGRYGNVALQMLDSGDWLTPRRNHETIHVTKPPLTYWAIAASAGLFGRSEWALRLPMAVAFALTASLLVPLGRMLVPRRPWLPILVYVTSPLPFFAAGVITTDTLLTCFETAAMVAYVHFRFGGGRARWLDAMWALFAVAWMVKGPPALLPLLAVAAWELRSRSGALLRPLGLVAFVLIGLSWFAWIVHRHPELLAYFLREEVLARVASGDHHRNSQWYGAFVVYVPTLLLGAPPWSALVGTRLLRAGRPPLPLAWAFLALWIGLPLAVFFLSRSRLPLYLLPLFVPLSVLAAMVLAQIAPTARRVTQLAAWLALLLAVKGGLALVPNAQDARALSRELAALMPTPPSEIVFVETKARYGLRFYLGAEVEAISLGDIADRHAGASGRWDDDLRHELAEGERGLYYLVPARHAGSFAARIRAAGRGLRHLGQARGWQVYVVEQTTVSSNHSAHRRVGASMRAPLDAS